MTSRQFIDGIGRLIDLVGVLAIAAGVLLAGGLAALRVARREQMIYGRFRREVGRGILLGLELLVAADVIRTVAINRSYRPEPGDGSGDHGAVATAARPGS